MLHPTDEQLRALRKVKQVPEAVMRILLDNLLVEQQKVGYLVQFQKDTRVYGLWEACLYLEGYEQKLVYKIGTANRVIAEVLKGAAPKA